MTSSTLYREGDDLDTLLAELSAEHGNRVRVVAVDEERPAGRRGRFARRRVSVQYRLEPDAESAHSADPLAELIARADAAETGAGPVAEPGPPFAESGAPGANVEFASMLLELAAQKAAERGSPPVPPAPPTRPSPRPAAPAVPAAPPVPAAPAVPAPPVPAVPPVRSAPPTVASASFAQPAIGTDAGLVLRCRLADIGVPVHLLPSTAVDPVAAVTNIVAALPDMPRPPVGRRTILALVGPSTELVATARRLAPDLGIPADRVWVAGLPAGALPAALDLQDAWEAASAARAARDGSDELVLALVATDVVPAAGRNRQPARIVAALEADAVWAVVDATRKPTDSRRRLAELGTATAAVVVDAAETSSPATVLELGLPVAMLDGEPATRRRWIAALLAALADQES